jgi:hypothetical protein
MVPAVSQHRSAFIVSVQPSRKFRNCFARKIKYGTVTQHNIPEDPNVRLTTSPAAVAVTQSGCTVNLQFHIETLRTAAASEVNCRERCSGCREAGKMFLGQHMGRGVGQTVSFTFRPFPVTAHEERKRGFTRSNRGKLE